jgi:hypothetical protein
LEFSEEVFPAFDTNAEMVEHPVRCGGLLADFTDLFLLFAGDF